MTKRNGFTLIELMISLALMAVLMLGVNFIFSAVGRATGSATMMSKMSRDIQGAQSIFASDFASAVVRTEDIPFFIIHSTATPAFRNRADQLSAPQQDNPLISLDDSGSEVTQSGMIYNSRNHRTDRLKFFARGKFPRQTGNDGTYAADMISSEAQISFGHLKLWAGAGTLATGTLSTATRFPDPGEAPVKDNANNFFATQWVLGRSVLLMTSPNSTGKILDQNNVSQAYYTRLNLPTTGLQSAATPPGDPAFEVQSSRFDLVGTTMAGERQRIIDYITASPATTWWDAHTYRFWANPLLLRSGGDMAAYASQTAPLFLAGCTQFIVEFAGDYLKQDPATGNITDVQSFTSGTFPAISAVYTGSTDGEVDYIVNPDKSRQVRWYGMPRDTDGDGRISISGASNAITDVVPLRDIIRKTTLPGAATAHGAPMERTVTNAPGSGDYATAAFSTTYSCVWGPGGSYGTIPNAIEPTKPIPVPAPALPKMIRITIVLDEPTGKLSDPPTYSYVFSLR